MITLEGSRLVFRFPEVHEHATCEIHFQRTLRIPDDGKTYPLPPGLGAFPLRHLDDFVERLPANMFDRGGIIMPMRQAEAMWICFGGGRGHGGYPFAVKIAAGKINAVTGQGWARSLKDAPQDYVVTPDQPWLDGFCVEKGVIRQFVAMPLGEGYSAEEQITGDAEHGGLQLIVYPMKAERYEELVKTRAAAFRVLRYRSPAAAGSMGLAPGGRMRQQIFDDKYGLDAWDQRHSSRCFVTIANSATWAAITREPPPAQPPMAKHYSDAGLPWFDYYDADAKAVEGAPSLNALKSVAAMGKEKGETPLPDNASVQVKQLISLAKRTSAQVREFS